MASSIKSWFKNHITTDNLYYAIKISIGIVLSILIAEFLNIDFAPSTGVVTLLGIESTRRGSLYTARHRGISFLYTLLICYLVHDGIGTSTKAFALAISFVVIISIFLGWFHTLSVNTVVAFHLFIMAEPFTIHLIVNEALRVLIGVTIALMLSWLIHPKINKNMAAVNSVDESISQLLFTFCKILKREAPLNEDIPSRLEHLQHLIEDGSDLAFRYYNNVLEEHARFFIDYMNMRGSELELLKHIHQQISHMDIQNNPASADALASLMEEMAPTISLKYSVKLWADSYQETASVLDSTKLPGTRAEFLSQATAYYILQDLSEMIRLKHMLVSSLSKEQKERYLS
ncbi:MAG: aromatic acid exporter family protein [Hespellia sp.]|nr:aromatic acid exporter family protein [Hespellia sp.]